ncbi:MAG: hypothetical protein F6J87_06050 [Spirulina sp. SIO3F2]|nr:hypothetical protein [Spirulina sp. SIO3F2]
MDNIQTLIDGVRQDFATQFQELGQATFQQIQEMRTELRGLTPVAPPEPVSPAAPPPSTPSTDGVEPTEGGVELQGSSTQVAALEQRLADMEQRWQDSQAENERLMAVQNFTQIASDRCIDPSALLVIAEARNLVKLQEDEYRVLTGKNKTTGQAIYTSTKEGLDTLLQTFPYLENPRPGNGTGAAPTQPNPTRKGYDTGADIMVAVMNEKDDSMNVWQDVSNQ